MTNIQILAQNSKILYNLPVNKTIVIESKGLFQVFYSTAAIHYLPIHAAIHTPTNPQFVAVEGDQGKGNEI